MISNYVEKNEEKVKRFFEIFVGLSTWALFLSPIWLGIIAPKIMILYITFLTVMWSYLALKHTYGTIVGYKKYRRELKQDWAEMNSNLDFSKLPDKKTLPPSLEETKHLILIPVVDEPEKVFQGTLDALLGQTHPINTVTLVFSAEEKFAETVIGRIKKILGDNINKFDEVLFYSHPKNIPGEAIGAAAPNRTWGGKHAVEHLKNTGKNIRNYIFTTFDSDSQLHHKFISRLTHLYLTTDNRDSHFYSTAVHLFNNNIWDVPTMMRIEANAVTLGSLADWGVTSKAFKETFSCYSASLKTLIQADYWDVQLGADDTVFYWRSFFARNGDFVGTEHYIPYSADAVQADTPWRSHVSMYLQLRRWGWGTIAFPHAIAGFLKNTEIPLIKKVGWTVKNFQIRILFLSLVFLMTFGISIVTLANKDAAQINLVYALPDALSVLLTVTFIFLIPLTYFRSKIVKPWPKDWSFYKKFVTLLEGPLVILNLFTYSLIPWVDAQTRMVLGKKMQDQYYTPKVRS